VRAHLPRLPSRRRKTRKNPSRCVPPRNSATPATISLAGIGAQPSKPIFASRSIYSPRPPHATGGRGGENEKTVRAGVHAEKPLSELTSQEPYRPPLAGAALPSPDGRRDDAGRAVRRLRRGRRRAADLKVTARRFSQLFLTKGGRRAVDSWVGGFGSSWPPLVPFI